MLAAVKGGEVKSKVLASDFNGNIKNMICRFLCLA